MTITVNTIIICNTWNNSIDAKHRELNILEYDKINKETFDSTMNLVDQIVSDIFDRYTIMNTDMKADLYMNEDMINEMMFNVLKETYQSLSPQLINKLNSIYNREYVDDIITKKVQMLTMSYVIQVNGSYKS